MIVRLQHRDGVPCHLAGTRTATSVQRRLAATGLRHRHPACFQQGDGGKPDRGTHGVHRACHEQADARCVLANTLDHSVLPGRRAFDRFVILGMLSAGTQQHI
jgi:hypothetical protein